MSSSAVNLKMDCGSCPIRNQAVCSRCDEDEIKILEDIKYYRNYDAGQMIAWAGDELQFVASVVTGVASLSKTLEDGRTQMVGLSLPADFIGRPGRAECAYDVRAVAPVTLCCFRRKPFEQLLVSTPHVAERLLDMTMDELDSARQWMLVLGRKTAREKLASFLAILAKREATLNAHPVTKDVAVHLPLTREAIADYLGLTLETVSRQFSAFKRQGLIIMDGQRDLTIPDLAALVTESGDDFDGGVIV